MSSTISSTITTGITLGAVTTLPTYASPLTITSSGYVDNTGTGSAIFGSISQFWTVFNYGRIVATDTAGNGINSGTIVGNEGAVHPGFGGSVTNTSVGVISGRPKAGANAGGGAATVINYGTVNGDGATGIGADHASGATVVDAGAIVGSRGTAVFRGGARNNRLVLDPGCTLTGAIVVSGTSNALELGSGTAGGIADEGPRRFRHGHGRQRRGLDGCRGEYDCLGRNADERRHAA